MEITDKQRTNIIDLQKNPSVKGVDVRDQDGGLQYVSFDHIAKILTWDEWIDQYPEAMPEYKAAPPPEPNYASPEDQFISDETWRLLESQNEQYKTISRVDRVMMYDRFRKAKDFKKFLLEERAITPSGAVVADWQRSDKRGVYKIVLKYVVYNTMRNFQEKYRRRKKFAQEKEWEGIMKTQG